MLSLLKGKPDAERSASFVCALAFMRHEKDPSPVVCVARWDGIILPVPQGSNGFGYDPLFAPEGYEMSFAELGEEIKNSMSHRSRALEGVVDWLSRRFPLG